MTAPIVPVLWSGTLRRDTPVRDRVAAAVGAGYGAVTVSFDDLFAEDSAGGSIDDLVAHAADVGAPISVIDPLWSWLPRDDGRPPGLSTFDALAMTERVRPWAVSLLARTTSLPVDAVAGHLAAAADAMASLGARVQLEFAPGSGIADLRSALAVVDLAGRANAGVVFDTWHFCRGTPDMDVLRAAPGSRIFAVQISDAARDVVGTLHDDTMHHRLLPGDGSFPLVEIVRALHDIDGLTMYGPEVLSDELHRRPATDVARLNAERLDGLLATALVR
ncbi:MAG: sugar phosphate isomerase/epimerase [Ilumatobacteraceae bacterium]